MLDPRVIDPGQEVVDYAALSDDEIAEIVLLLTAIRTWREHEQRLMLESRDHMQLNESDMKALRFLVAAKGQGRLVTPGMITEHLGISSAATTKLLDRLEYAGHIARAPHPSDRRALAITITQSTHEQVRDTVGRTHARRFAAAARLTSAERDVVTRFLGDLSGIEPEPGPADALTGAIPLPIPAVPPTASPDSPATGGPRP
ncbi:MarR family transcriptional regulator [Agromyces sp. MMS17-SY077]|uniref:MarR family transcriptional regulator n=2 Tax=Agromyces seonyuensis TaxID=2662446 RepID=A0A6I4NYH6_9MICO|nr:MarR family transcriptional regulator [Agromyces seonyuensis]